MRKWLGSVALGCSLALPCVALAEDEAPNTGALTFSGGADYVTSYYFRGYEQEDTGLIVQPYATLGIKAFEGETVKVTPFLGTWNSIHENHTLSDGSNDAWYESDFFFGADIGVGKFTISPIYTFYTYPNGAYNTIEELGVKVAFDDTDCMKAVDVPFALKPYVAWYMETDDGNGEEDQYAEVGIGPSLAIPDTSLTLTVPLALGLSPDGYYLSDDGSNETVGYASAGLLASVPLPIPTRFGSWTLTAGVTYIHLFADSTEAVNDDDDSDIIGKVGISFVY